MGLTSEVRNGAEVLPTLSLRAVLKQSDPRVGRLPKTLVCGGLRTTLVGCVFATTYRARIGGDFGRCLTSRYTVPSPAPRFAALFVRTALSAQQNDLRTINDDARPYQTNAACPGCSDAGLNAATNKLSFEFRDRWEDSEHQTAV
jgi:hypothetical protein